MKHNGALIQKKARWCGQTGGKGPKRGTAAESNDQRLQETTNSELNGRAIAPAASQWLQARWRRLTAERKGTGLSSRQTLRLEMDKWAWGNTGSEGFSELER